MNTTTPRARVPASPGSIAATGDGSDPVRSRQAGLTVLLGRIPLIGLLTVQAAIGYEWFMSGLTKIIRGGFPAGLAEELEEKSVGSPGWYRTIIDDVLIPNAPTVGYLTEIGELLVGIALVGVAVTFIFAPDRLTPRIQEALFALTAIAGVLALVMNVNFHLANGSAHPWLVPNDGFDEGVDLDSLMPFIEITLVVVSIVAVRRLRRFRRDAAPAPSVRSMA